MKTGYRGNLLRVDLTQGKVSIEHPDEIIYRRYLGGRGLIAYYLVKELVPGIDPLGAENKLIFALGPATGLPLAGSGRHSVGAKSPLTGGFGESESGGFFGAELKNAGYDVLIIEGKAANPVYLWIKDQEVEIRDASHLWGMDVAETENLIQQELGDEKIRTAQIGPAGENLVLYASVMNDVVHAAARGGMGAVMGSKNLKAIAVRASDKVKAANPETIARWAKEVRQDTYKTEGLTRFGTAGVVAGHGKSGNLPVRNFRDGYFEGVEKIDGKSLFDLFRTGSTSCFACYVRCDQVTAGKSRWGDIDSRYGGPEYETIASLGSLCGVSDLSAIVKGNEYCNKYGMDTISCGATIAFAMECFENGIIDKKDTGGIELEFGNAESMVQMIQMIALREGFGNVLAEGAKRAALIIGEEATKYAMHVKGMEIPMHEPRFKKGHGLGMAINPAGPDHACSVHDTMLTTEEGLSDYKSVGVLETMPTIELSPRKVAAIYKAGLVRHFTNNIVFCSFIPYPVTAYHEIINAATGWNMSVYEIFKVVERSVTLAQLFNLREGFTEADNAYPTRFHTSQRGGSLEGVIIEPEAFVECKRLLYGMWGWDPDTAIPTRSRLTELDLDWVSEILPVNK